MNTKEAMNIKKAIDLLERLQNPHLKWLEEHNDNMDSIIALLKQGEKYKQMWEELEKEKCLLIDFDDEGYFKGQRKLGDIKQKYFPKESKNKDKMICGLCKHYDDNTEYCLLHPSYGELVRRDTCQDFEEGD